MQLNDIERALAAVERMIRARAALQSILGDKYWSVVKGFKDSIQEEIRKTGESPIAVTERMAANYLNEMLILMVLAGCLEAIEETANYVWRKK
jgi:hypothetical protein